MPMIEVPAHVQHENVVQNQVQVVGGTNWDLSRTAVETPVAMLPDPPPPVPEFPGYRPEQNMPSADPDVTVHYPKNSVLVSKQAAVSLKALNPHSKVLVAGHADFDEHVPARLAQRRAQAVAALLKRQGHKVEAVRSFADEVPKTEDPEKAELNRRVEVFER
jgi:outer membrane protein OmpA-like peptidoglycan-associated protein